MSPNYYLADILQTVGSHIATLEFAGGSFFLFLSPFCAKLLLLHTHDVYVSTGGWMEHVLTQNDPESAVDKYLDKCKDPGFDVVELSNGVLSVLPDDWLRLCDRVMQKGLKPKPELGVQFGDTEASELEVMGTTDSTRVINRAKKFVDMDVERVMIESEGITENVKSWRTDVIQAILRDIPLDKAMFEAANPKVFNW